MEQQMGVDVDIDMDIEVEEVRREEKEKVGYEVDIEEGLEDVPILNLMDEDVDERPQDPQVVVLQV